MIKAYPIIKAIYVTDCRKCGAYIVYDEDETFYSPLYDCDVLMCPRCKITNRHSEKNAMR